MLVPNRVPGVKIGYCQDIWCDGKPLMTTVTFARYIASTDGPAWLCKDCLERWSDALEDYTNTEVNLDLRAPTLRRATAFLL